MDGPSHSHTSINNFIFICGLFLKSLILPLSAANLWLYNKTKHKNKFCLQNLLPRHKFCLLLFFFFLLVYKLWGVQLPMLASTSMNPPLIPQYQNNGRQRESETESWRETKENLAKRRTNSSDKGELTEPNHYAQDYEKTDRSMYVQTCITSKSQRLYLYSSLVCKK